MRTLKLLAAAVLLTALGACGPLTSERLADAKAMKPSGNAFQTALYNGYIKSASYELGQLMNLRIAELQIDKAMMAAKGQTPAADDPNNPEYASRMRADQAPLLKSAYSRMQTVFNAGGTTWAPEKAAEAQVAYDCWLQHEVEGWIKGGYHTLKLAECKAAFEAAIAAVEAAKPKAAAPAPAPAPAPAAKLPGPWTVLFDWDKFNIWRYESTVTEPVYRAYSMANSPCRSCSGAPRLMIARSRPRSVLPRSFRPVSSSSGVRARSLTSRCASATRSVKCGTVRSIWRIQAWYSLSACVYSAGVMS